MAKIILLGASITNLYYHRLELIKRLVAEHHEVVLAAPAQGEEKKLKELGAEYIELPVDNRGKNPVNDIILLWRLLRIFRKVKPDVALTFYTKVNIYAGLAARITKTPYIENITGLGTAIGNGGILSRFMVRLYSMAVRGADMVFFQNRSNLKFFRDRKISMKRTTLLPGSGVCLSRFPLLSYPESENKEFIFISRILKEKGIFEFVEAARIIKSRWPETVFHAVGPYGEEYENYLKKAQKEGIIELYGKVSDIHPLLQRVHCCVYPSYYGEGMANVLLESASSGRALITTDMPGCRETVDDGITGFIIRPRETSDLVEKIERFLALTYDEQKKMGEQGRNKMEREFDRNIVIDAYLNEISNSLKSNR